MVDSHQTGTSWVRRECQWPCRSCTAHGRRARRACLEIASAELGAGASGSPTVPLRDRADEAVPDGRDGGRGRWRTGAMAS
jgi:hypothetical protein